MLLDRWRGLGRRQGTPAAPLGKSIGKSKGGIAVLAGCAPIYTPSAGTVADSQLSAFMDYCAGRAIQTFDSYESFDRFAIQKAEDFWSMLLHWSELLFEGDVAPAVVGNECETARFFPKLRLNYAEN